MNDALNRKSHSQPQSVEEACAAALNEQGYLLQHKLADVLTSPKSTTDDSPEWQIEAEEVPVSLPNGAQTRVDLLLRYGTGKRPLWRAVIESKRSAKEFKQWIFFGQSERSGGPSPQKYYIESASLAGHWNEISESNPPMSHGLNNYDAPAECEVFDYGLEVRTGMDKKASATTAIEEALYQVTLGQAGVAARLRRAKELNFNLIPIIVTTANLCAANFPVEKVSLDAGKIEPADLRIEPRKWLAVSYRISDVISQLSQFSIHPCSDFGAHLSLWQIRTVFVVRATEIQPFLHWLGSTLCSGR